MGIKEKDLIDILKNSKDVQDVIRRICGAVPEADRQERAERGGPDSGLRRQCVDKREYDILQDRWKQAETDLAALERERREDKSAIFRLKQAVSEKENEIDSLKRALNEMGRRVSEANDRICAAEREKESLKRDREQMERELSAARAKAVRFEKPLVYLERYHSLSDGVKEGLSNVICDKNVILFVASAASPEALRAVWNYVRDMLGDRTAGAEIGTLKEIFDYFFDIYNSSLAEPVYKRDEVEIGDDLDDDRHDRGAGSATSGRITQVLLRGYQSIHTGKIQCRSVVKV